MDSLIYTWTNPSHVHRKRTYKDHQSSKYHPTDPGPPVRVSSFLRWFSPIIETNGATGVSSWHQSTVKSTDHLRQEWHTTSSQDVWVNLYSIQAFSKTITNNQINLSSRYFHPWRFIGLEFRPTRSRNYGKCCWPETKFSSRCRGLPKDRNKRNIIL